MSIGRPQLGREAVRDAVLLVDLSGMQGVEVDAAARIAVVRRPPVARSYSANSAKYGLFFPTGHASTVGLGGFALGGGYGWNSRTFGPACLSIRAIDVVLADGSFVHADDRAIETCCGQRAAADRVLRDRD